MFVSENQQDRGVLKYGFQLYMGISGYPVLNRAEMLWNEINWKENPSKSIIKAMLREALYVPHDN